MRELEGQAVSDVSSEVAGTRAGSTGLCLLARPREMAVKTKKSVIWSYFCASCVLQFHLILALPTNV